MAAVQAGVRTIEHGTYLDGECCEAMRETGTVLVPTRTIMEEMLASSGLMPGFVRTKLAAVEDTHAKAVALAIERGVTIAAGTDILLTGPSLPCSWGRN